MGCSLSTECQHKAIYKQTPKITSKNSIELEKGGIIIQTKIGNIQYGILPETVKDALKMGV